MCHDDIHPEFYNLATPRARKPHRCCECLRTIEIGERYERVSAMYDGRIADIKTCGNCADLWASIDIECRAHGELREAIYEVAELDRTDQMKSFIEHRGENYQRIKKERESVQ